MSDGVTIPVVHGSVDGLPPVYNPDGRFQVWRLDQLWFGTHGDKRYVPNVEDRVLDTSTRKWYKVVRVDQVTLVPELVLDDAAVNTGNHSLEDLLIGVGPGRHSDTFRVYIDKSVRPFTLAIDARCMVAGSDLTKFQICRGNELDGSLRVISGLYNQTGTYLGTDVPLELARMRDHSNYTVKSFPTCYTSDELEDNEVVQVRVFSDSGALRAKFECLVENTAYIRLTDTSQKYVTHISLDSPFMSTSNPTVLEYPLNVPLSGLNLFGIVHYNDGTTRRLAVDGTKFQIFGFNNFIASVVGERTPLVLQYNLAKDEIHYGSTLTTTHSIQQNYTAISTKEDGSYSVKLFAYPVWVNATTGYRLEFFMFNLDRRTWQKVTAFTKYNTNLPAFNPRQYGVAQQISVSINLADVNPSFKQWIHTQVIDIVLNRNATDYTTNPWTVAFERNQTPPFGVDNWARVRFVNANLKYINIACEETRLDSWLERVYYRTKPLFSDMKEAKAPAPNMFALQVGNKTYEFPINQWNTELPVDALINAYDNIYVRFIKRTADYDLQLAIACLPVLPLTALN